MRISNNAYDTIKWIALNFIPALEVFILAVGDIWSIPYYVPIATTVAAVGVFLAAIIGVTKSTYLADQQKQQEEDDIK